MYSQIDAIFLLNRFIESRAAYRTVHARFSVIEIDGNLLTDAGKTVLYRQSSGIEYAIWERSVGDSIKVDSIRNAVYRSARYQLKQYNGAIGVPNFEPKLLL